MYAPWGRAGCPHKILKDEDIFDFELEMIDERVRDDDDADFEKKQKILLQHNTQRPAANFTLHDEAPSPFPNGGVFCGFCPLAP